MYCVSAGAHCSSRVYISHTISQSETEIYVTCDVIEEIIYYSLSLANQSSVFGSRDQEQPFRGHYSGNTTFDTLGLGLGYGVGLGLGLGFG